MKLITVNNKQNRILFSAYNKDFPEGPPARAIISAGAFKAEVQTGLDDDIAPGHIGIPKGLFPFTLPEQIEYRMKTQGRVIMLGPVIAYIPFDKSVPLNTRTLNRIIPYFFHYTEVGGLIYVCNSRSFDFDSQTVDGYAYIPGATPFECKWQHGRYPLPASMYKRVDVGEDTYNKLLAYMGDAIFNSYFFDKYELYQYMSNYPGLREHLPETKALESAADLVDFLSRYNAVYLKPMFSSKSRGIVTVHKAGGDKCVFLQKGKKDKEYTADEFEDAIKDIMAADQYLIQQGIEIDEYAGRRYDFRVIMQKDESRRWGCTGIITRFGKVNAPVTNFMQAGFAKPGDEGLKLGFSATAKEAFVIKQDMIKVCGDVCRRLDETSGNYGDVGVDVVVDKDRRVWILEINKLHDHKFPLYAIKDEQMYYNVITHPFRYAKALAGF